MTFQSRPGAQAADASRALERGRAYFRLRAWSAAYRSLSSAAEHAMLEADDLEQLATSAYLAGHDEAYLRTLEQSYQAHLVTPDRRRAARCAFWLGLGLLFRGETGRASGWLSRAERLLTGEDECAEHGYLMLPVAEQQLAAGDCDAAYATAARAAEIGERCGEIDLSACARHIQGRARLQQGHIDDGLALLDEAMVAVTAGEVSPIMTGLIYCSVIEACQEIYAIARAREWTTALASWCERQPELIAFTGVCHVHRAEIMQLQGRWQEALEEARRAWLRSQSVNARAAAAALYQQAEVHRLRGESEAAERAYRSASDLGMEPQPGLALLRIAQGRRGSAVAALRRALDATSDPRQRSRLLPAYIDVLLAAGEIEQAGAACTELENVARDFASDALVAMGAQGRGAVDLAKGDARAALRSLRSAFEAWRQVGATYLAARTRVLLGSACRALGDDEGAELELGAARLVFAELGAEADVARIDALNRQQRSNGQHGLTRREQQVLRLIAAGKTNKTIAAELSLSKKTIDRHVSNIFRKLDVCSRAAATAYAYSHKIV